MFFMIDRHNRRTGKPFGYSYPLRGRLRGCERRSYLNGIALQRAFRLEPAQAGFVDWSCGLQAVGTGGDVGSVHRHKT